MGKEQRVGSIEVREDKEGKRMITGHAAVFNQETNIGGMFREVVKPGAFKRAIKEKQDVRAVFNHDPGVVLGRVGNGTVRLKEDDTGLRVEIDPPDTGAARDLMTNIDRGDITGMSFKFAPVKGGQRWIEDDDGEIRELTDVDLYDVSPVTYPAYEGTDLAARSSEEMYNEHRQEADSDADDGAQERETLRRKIELIELED